MCISPSNPPKTKYSHSGTCAYRPLTLLKLNILTLGHVHRPPTLLKLNILTLGHVHRPLTLLKLNILTLGHVHIALLPS